jgi:hypothetical protein
VTDQGAFATTDCAVYFVRAEEFQRAAARYLRGGYEGLEWRC